MKFGKRVAVVCMVLAMHCVLWGCGNSTDADGRALITSKWVLVEWTVNGKTTVIKDDPIAALTVDKQPAFSSSDGSSCVFSNNGKSHKGTLEYQGDGKYRVSFTDVKPVNLVITGNRLNLSNDAKTFEIVFETE